ncbi:MAG TPA: 5-formyltetrahydrofolate cyclo-ligase [Limnochordia bacterium]
MDKETYRRIALARRDAIPPGIAQQKSARIRQRVLRLSAFRKAGCVLGYVSVRSEVSTRKLLADVLAAGKRLALPLVRQGERELSAHAVSDLGTLVHGPFGIPSPDPARHPSVDPGAIDLVMVPGVGFDRRGFRLGYGFGYYDAFLGRLRGRATLVGLAFREQLFDYLPQAAHDVPVDILVTDAGAFWPIQPALNAGGSLRP